MKLEKDVLQKIRAIEIHTRRLLKGTQLGEYSSLQKGTGLEFEQLREYHPGDDIRFIDWKSSARQDKIMVREYLEDRNRTIMLLVDVSGSQGYGSDLFLKQEIVAQVSSALALIAQASKDSVGLILFSDEVKKIIPPARGKKQVHTIMQELFSVQPAGSTNFNQALHRLLAMKRKDCVAFIISDFMTDGYQKLLRLVSKHYETIAIRCLDTRELVFAHVGYVMMQDIESDNQSFMATQHKHFQNALQVLAKKSEDTLRSCGVDILDIDVQQEFIGHLVRFFRQRLV